MINPIIILELDQLLDQQDWYTAVGLTDGVTTLEPGYWYKTITIDGGTGLGFGTFWGAGYNTIKFQVGSFAVANEDYTEVSTFANLVSQNKSFLFDVDTQTIYVHFDGLDPYDVFTDKKIGYTIGFSKDTSGGYTTEGGIFFQPRLSNLSNISYSIDPFFFGVAQNPSASATILNDAGENIDDIATRNLFGSPARVKIGLPDDAFTEFKTLFTGRIANIPSVGQDEVNFSLKSERAFLTRKIPENFFADTIDDEKKRGKPYPLPFGKIYGQEAVRVSEAAGTVTYKLADTSTTIGTNGIKQIDAVYVDGVSNATYSDDLANGGFTIAGTEVKDGSTYLKVTADFIGVKDGSGDAITNGLEIARAILLEYEGTSYIAANYNLTEWAAAEADADDIGISLGGQGKAEKIEDILVKIARTLQGSFIYQPDGKITFRKKEEADARFYAQKKHQLSLEFAQYNELQYLSSATCNYAEDLNEKEFRSETDTSLESTVLSTYRVPNNQEFDTLLTSLTDAAAYALAIATDNQDIPPIFPVTLPLSSLPVTKIDNCDYVNLEVFNNVLVEVKRQEQDFYGDIKGIIRNISIDLNAYEVKLEVERIEDTSIVQEVWPYYWFIISQTGEPIVGGSDVYLQREDEAEWLTE
jgi:hypothetical protein